MVSPLISGIPYFHFQSKYRMFFDAFLKVWCGLGCASGHLQRVLLALLAGSDGLCGSFRKAWGSVHALWITAFWPGRLQGVLNEGAVGSREALCSSFFEVICS